MATIELNDQFTNEWTVFEEAVYKYYDNEPNAAPPVITISDCDGIIYKKINDKYYRRVLTEGKINVEWFGAKGDGKTNDTENINKAVLFLSKIGGGILNFTSNKRYLVSEPIFITDRVSFHCNGATFSGNKTNTILKTAYLLNDNLTSNHETDPETNIITFSQIKDANFEECVVALDFFNFCHGSSLENIKFTDCEVSWKFSRCFYTSIKNVMSSGANNNQFAYQFLEQNNALLLERVSATKDLGFLFQGGTTATNLISCTTEGGKTGMKFVQDCLGITITGLYAETTKNVIDLSEVHIGNFEISNSYFNYTDQPLIGPDYLGQPEEEKEDREVSGYWRNNTIANINKEYNNFIYRGLMDVSQPRNYIKYELPTYEGPRDLPANWIVGDFTNITAFDQVKATDTKAIGNVKRQFGIIPVTRSGDVGEGKVGFIPDCTHELIGSDPSNFGIKIKTKIKFQEYMMFAKYNIYIGTYSYGRWFYGDIFGKNLSSKDVGNTQVTSIENENGLLVITITGFNEPNLNYFIQGNVQLIV